MLGIGEIDKTFEPVTVLDSGEELAHRNDETIIDERMAASPVPPMWRCKRRHIASASYVLHDAITMHEVVRELCNAASDDSFEVIYDRATTTDCARPGHHVYRVIRYGGVPSDDILQLEFSCKKDFDKPWTADNSKAPGYWIVEHFKKVDKARRIGDKAHVEADIARELETHNEAVKAANRKEELEQSQHFAKEVDTHARKKRVGRTFDGAKK